MESYKTEGVCAREINYTIEDGVLKDVKFIGGCNGNLKGISSLVEGMKVEDVIERLGGITCGPRNTSCPDQFSKALSRHLNEQDILKII